MFVTKNTHKYNNGKRKTMKKVAKNEMRSEEISEVRKQLPCGFGRILSGMIDGDLKDETIRKMFNGNRAMNSEVFKAAKQLVETIQKLKNTSDNETLK